MRKSITSILIVAAMLVSFIPAAFAENDTANGFEIINDNIIIEDKDSECVGVFDDIPSDIDETSELAIDDMDSVETNKNIIFMEPQVELLAASEINSNICGCWEGYYTGTVSGNLIQRNVTLYIDKCDDSGNIEGIFEFSTEDVFGQYHYTGSVDSINNSISFSGDYWIVNPDNYSSADFSGNIDIDNLKIVGVSDNNSERPFELTKVSDTRDRHFLSQNDLIGTWQGSYAGYRNSTVITRNVTLYIQNCDTNGDLEGIFQFDSPQEPLSSGAYKFEGTYSFSSGVINFKGTEWLDNPDNFSFGQFTGFPKSNDILEGYIDNEKDRTFSFKRVSDNIEIPLLDKNKIPTTWTGEYDGHKGDTVIRRTYKINILDIDSEGNIHGLAEFSPKPGMMYSASGSYRFSGKINFMTKKITFQGSTWIDYPDDDDYDSWSFAFFTAFISEDYKSFTGYVDDYSNRTIDMVAENDSTRSTTNSTSENAPIIKSIYLSDSTDKYDITKMDVNIEEDSPVSVALDVDVDWNGNIGGEIYITQGTKKSIEIPNGKLTFKPGEELSAGKTVYILAVDKNTGKSTSTKVKLRVNAKNQIEWNPSSGTSKFNFKVGKDVGFTIPDSVVFPFGGMEIGFGLDFIPITFEYESENKINVAFGIDSSNVDETTNRFKGFSFKDYKETLKSSMKKNSNGYAAAKSNEKIIKELKKKHPDMKFDKVKFNVSKGLDMNTEVTGYAEMSYIDGGWHFNEGFLALNAEVSYSYQGQVFIWIVPCYYEFGGEIGAGIEGTLKDIKVDGFQPKLEGYITAKVGASIGGGVGVAKVCTLGAEGSGSLNLKTALHESYVKAWGEGDADFKVKVLGKTVASKNFAHGEFTIYETGNSKALIKDKNAVTLHSASDAYYDTIDINNIYENESRDYINKPTEWFGNEVQITLMSADYTNKNLSKLASNIYTEAKPQICEIDGKKIMVMQWDNTERADIDRTMLVYSVYDDTIGTWSAPVAVDDDGTADFYPCFKDGYLVWQNEKTTLTDDMTLKEIAELGEIYVTKWNGSGFDEAAALTDNNSLDTQPSVAATSNGASVIWTANTEGDILGITGKNSIMRSDFNGTSWSTPQTIKNNLNSITNITAGTVNNEFAVAYVVDDDNDLNTIDDRDVRIIRNSGEIQLTNNDVIDSNPVFADNKIYYYSEGNISYSDVDGANKQTVFDEAKPGLTDSFVVDSNANGDTAIWWTKAENGGAEVYASLYTDNAWSDEIQITSVGNKAKYPSGILNNNGSMIVAFNSGIMNENEITQTDLYTISVNPSYDIDITDAYFDEDSMTAYVTVKNSGELEISSYTLEFSGNNSKTVTEPLKAGKSVEVELAYNKPQDLTASTIELTASIDNDEYNTDNNTISFEIGHADIVVDNAAVNEAETVVSADISNTGYTNAQNVIVSLRDGSADGSVIDEQTIDVAVGEDTNVTFDINKSNMKFMDATKTLYVTAEIEEEEVSLGNNDSYVLIMSETGSADYEVEILNYNEVDGKYVINSIARNNTDKELICQLFSAVYSSDGTLKGCSYEQAVIDANDDTGVDITLFCPIEESDIVKTFMWKYYEPLAKAVELQITE